MRFYVPAKKITPQALIAYTNKQKTGVLLVLNKTS